MLVENVRIALDSQARTVGEGLKNCVCAEHRTAAVKIGFPRWRLQKATACCAILKTYHNQNNFVSVRRKTGTPTKNNES